MYLYVKLEKLFLYAAFHALMQLEDLRHREMDESM